MRATVITILTLLSTTFAFAGSPQISEGVRAMLSTEKESTTRAYIVTRHPPVYEAIREDGLRTFYNNEEILKFFVTLPDGVREKGLWIQGMGNSSDWTDTDRRGMDDLVSKARHLHATLFMCESNGPRAGAILPAWQCKQRSPEEGTVIIICEPVAGIDFSGHPRWTCQPK